jgi:hypothetical protein
MELYNPFEDVSKAATVPAQGAVIIRALVPTGNHIGHGQDLKRVTARTRGPRRPALEVYGRKSIKGVSKGSVQNGLKMIAEMPKATGIPRAPRTPGRVRIAQGKAALARNNGTPTGSTMGQRLR